MRIREEGGIQTMIRRFCSVSQEQSTFGVKPAKVLKKTQHDRRYFGYLLELGLIVF